MRDDIAALPENYKFCRVKRHRWEDHNVIEHKRDKMLEVIEKCSSCGLERVQFLSLRERTKGHILQLSGSGIRYSTAKGYLVPGGGRVSVDELGEMRVQRLGY